VASCAVVAHTGYSLPLPGFLHHTKKGGKRTLLMDLSTPIDGLYVQDLTVKVCMRLTPDTSQ
jgi:hypothetical protein